MRVRGGQEGSLAGAKLRCSGTQWGNEDHLEGEWTSEERGIQGDSEKEVLACLGSIPGACTSLLLSFTPGEPDWVARDGSGPVSPPPGGFCYTPGLGLVTDAEDLCSGTGAERSCLKEAWIRTEKLQVHKFSAGSHWERGWPGQGWTPGLELQHCNPEKKGGGHSALEAGTGEMG